MNKGVFLRLFDTGPKVRGVLLRPQPTPWLTVHNRPRFFSPCLPWPSCASGHCRACRKRHIHGSGAGHRRTGEYVLGANVIVDGQSQGASTNIYGFYSLTLPKGPATLTCSFIGYAPTVKNVDGSKTWSGMWNWPRNRSRWTPRLWWAPQAKTPKAPTSAKPKWPSPPSNASPP